MTKITWNTSFSKMEIPKALLKKCHILTWKKTQYKIVGGLRSKVKVPTSVI